MKAHLHSQEVIIDLNAPLKSIRPSVVLVWEDRFPSCAIGCLFFVVVFVFFLNFTRALLPAWPAKSEGIRGLVIDRHSVGVDHPVH